MTTIQIDISLPDLFTQHIRHIESIMNGVDDLIDLDPEIKSEIKDRVNRRWFDTFKQFEIDNNDPGFGYCEDCNSPSKLYAVLHMRYDYSEVREIWCAKCVANNVRRDYTSAQHVDETITSATLNYLTKFIRDYDESNPIERHKCRVCSVYVMEVNDRWSEHRYARDHDTQRATMTGIEARSMHDEDAVNQIVHKGCAEECKYCNEIVIVQNEPYEPGNYSLWRNLNGCLPSFRGKRICKTCWDKPIFDQDEDDYILCWCNSIYHTDAMYWSDVRDCHLCNDCYGQHVECGDCGYEYYEDDGHSCEPDMPDEDEHPYIHSYGFKPTPRFFPYYTQGIPYLGMELEVESRQNRFDEGAEYVATTIEGRGYLKYDGSLRHGFEIVTEPHTLTEIQNKFNWEILDKLVKLGFRSWDTSNCGLHVHISKNAFRDEKHKIAFTKLIYDNQRQVQRIAGRQSDYARFDDKGRIPTKIKTGNQDNGRYSAVNVDSINTFEVRVFKGSLRKERVLSAAEFVHAVYEYTKFLKIVAKDKPLSWVKFVGYVSHNSETYPNLFTIINETFEKDQIQEREDD